MSEITPFEIEIAEDVISDLIDRLSRTRWPDKELWTIGHKGYRSRTKKN